MCLHHLQGVFLILLILFNFIDFVTLAYKKRVPEDDVNTSKHVGVLCEMDVTVNILCIVDLNNKLRVNSSAQHCVNAYKKYILFYSDTSTNVIPYLSPCHKQILHSHTDIYCKLLYSRLLYFSLCLLVVQGSG